MGISKRELLNDYYIDEIGEIIHEYNQLHKPKDNKDEDQVTPMYADEFFGL